MSDLLLGFQVLLSPATLGYCFLGVFLGTIVGILPGLGPLTTMALLLPLTYTMDVTSAIIMLSGIFYGTAYGGTATSVLMRIPGEVSTVVTCYDGYAMARNGRAGAALGISAIGSFVAATFGIIVMSWISEPLAMLVYAFGPAEYATLMLAALALVLYFSGGSMLKAVLMAMFGLLLGSVGSDPSDLTPRLTFGAISLLGGIDIVALAVGLFGLSEVIGMALMKPERLKMIAPPSSLLGFMPTREEARRSVKPVMRGTVLGFVAGVIPGGGLMSSFLSYSLERKLSSRPEEFGRGAVEGVAGPESANNGAAIGAFVPLLCMGIPSSAIMAVLMGAFMIQGVSPGPQIIQNNPEIFWGVIASMYLGNVMLLILNLPLIGLMIRVLEVPRAFLAPIILVICLIGVYSSNGSPYDVMLAVVFGFIGFFLRRQGFDLGLVILAFVLGPIMERSVRQALSISNGDLAIFVHGPISIGFVLVTVSILLFAALSRRRVPVEP